MSDERKQAASAEPSGSEPEAGSISRLLDSIFDSIIIRDTIKLLGWIAAILVIAGLCWTLTQSVRSRFLIRAVNRVLEQSGDYRRIVELSSPDRNSSLIGSWYTMTMANQLAISFYENYSEGSKAFIFSFVAEGTFFPCLAVVSPDGKVQEFIPLNTYGKKILSQISPGILKLYIRRIEGQKS